MSLASFLGGVVLVVMVVVEALIVFVAPLPVVAVVLVSVRMLGFVMVG